MPGKPPNEWKVLHYANIGTSEEFVAQFLEIASDLLGATTIFDPERQEIVDAIWTVMDEGLVPAFNHLKRIRASVTQQLPILDRRQLYEDFARVLWHAYKDLMPKAAKLFGPEIGFLFQNDANFEKGLAAFEQAYPYITPGFGDFLRAQRTSWQNGLADFRNHCLEHREDGPEKYSDFYKPENAEVLFDVVWLTIADILVAFLAMHLLPICGLQEIPPAERSGNPVRRFRFVLLQPVQRQAEPTDKPPEQQQP